MPITLAMLRIITLSLAAAWLSACSFSESSASISGSVESISKSSTSSSGSSSGESLAKDKVPYRDDVANLTFSVAGSSMTAPEFPNALSRTASQFKISNWSQEKATYYGIGKGLKRAGIAQENISRVPYLANVLNGRKDALSLIVEGYKQ